MMKKTLTVLSGIAAAVLAAACVLIFIASDREAPIISIQPMKLSYSDGEDTELLVEGVSAYDYRDGDVTDSVLVKDVVVLNNGIQAKVVYAARDKANNISEEYRIVDYIKQEEPDGTLLVPLEDLYADSGEIQEPEDALEEGTEESAEGTDSEDTAEGESEPEPEPEPQPEPAKTECYPANKPAAKPADNKEPKITLKQQSITLKPGQAIDPMSLIKSKSNADNVTVAGNVNLNVPGTYNMVYTAVGADGKTATANLKIVVE